MSTPLPSNLDFEQCIRGAYDDLTATLRTSTQITGPINMNGEVLVDIRASDGDSALVYGTLNGTPSGTIQILKINADGSLNVNQGLPNTINNAWPIKLTDGTNTTLVNPDGSLNVANISSIVATTGTLTNITPSLTSQLIFSLNANRKGFLLYNDSDQICYIAFSLISNSSLYTILLNPGMTYQNEAIIYTGLVSVIWNINATGFLRVTSLT